MIAQAQIEAAMAAYCDISKDDPGLMLGSAMHAALEAAEAAAWQPIEMAPKDGTELLLRWRCRRFIGGWSERHQVWTGAEFEPTHWAPLPELQPC